MMYFDYDHEVVATTDVIKISVADLRDLVNAVCLPRAEDQLAEMQNLLANISCRNQLPDAAFKIISEELTHEPPNHLAGPAPKM